MNDLRVHTAPKDEVVSLPSLSTCPILTNPFPSHARHYASTGPRPGLRAKDPLRGQLASVRHRPRGHGRNVGNSLTSAAIMGAQMDLRLTGSRPRLPTQLSSTRTRTSRTTVAPRSPSRAARSPLHYAPWPRPRARRLRDARPPLPRVGRLWCP